MVSLTFKAQKISCAKTGGRLRVSNPGHGKVTNTHDLWIFGECAYLYDVVCILIKNSSASETR